MDGFMKLLEAKLVPVARKLDQNRYLTAIKDGFFAVMPLLIIGSMFLLIPNIPSEAYQNFMASKLGEDWSKYILIPFDATMNLMTIFVMIGMAKSLGRSFDIDDVTSIVTALVGFLILTPMTELINDGGQGLPVANFTATGLFVGIFSTIFAIKIFSIIKNKGWTIKMPGNVPANVATSFSSLIPELFVILIFTAIRIAFSFTTFETVQNFLYTILQKPLTNIGGNLIFLIIVVIIQQILWMFGIHGSNVTDGITKPIMFAQTAENAEAFAAGLELPNILNYQFYSNYVNIGGAGATLALVLIILFVAKSQRFKSLGKLSIGAGIFNINEPMIFGLPIVLNPIIVVPFIIAPLVNILLTYFVMSIGLVPLANGINIQWTTPPILSGLIISGWRGALHQVILIIIDGLIYYPFFRVVDKLELEKESLQNN
ncbi:MAG: PTS transporter subunit EIIC [Clostridiaceae bacterium]|nr:PTS transporter subunit EIIC [Clostridiaceae bacterium]MBW4860532.1 PTS transporter subunit EIIC [Clostridiaceae bacterium]MBW4868448.1 PTS transporter subunit EIIC [Clostridiaceae bacterium]